MDAGSDVGAGGNNSSTVDARAGGFSSPGTSGCGNGSGSAIRWNVAGSVPGGEVTHRTWVIMQDTHLVLPTGRTHVAQLDSTQASHRVAAGAADDLRVVEASVSRPRSFAIFFALSSNGNDGWA